MPQKNKIISATSTIQRWDHHVVFETSATNCLRCGVTSQKNGYLEMKKKNWEQKRAESDRRRRRWNQRRWQWGKMEITWCTSRQLYLPQPMGIECQSFTFTRRPTSIVHKYVTRLPPGWTDRRTRMDSSLWLVRDEVLSCVTCRDLNDSNDARDHPIRHKNTGWFRRNASS